MEFVGVHAVFLFGLFTLQVQCLPFPKGKTPTTFVLPDADGKLNVYDLPTGQGDGQLVQCPDGDLTIYDLGANDKNDADYRFWGGQQMRDFLVGKFHLVRNIVVTHGHWDHYNLLGDTFLSVADVSGLQNIYISCLLQDMPAELQDWITSVQATALVRSFNNGAGCGPIAGEPCETISFCPNSPGVVTHVMAANLGGHCTDGGNKNMDSVVTKVSWNDISVLLTGDFEDETSDWNEDGLQKQMVDFYGSEIQVTAFSFCHHGASNLANKPVLQNALMPKAIFVSGNPWYSYNHPRCSIVDGFIDFVQTLCRPAETNPVSPFYCGRHVDETVPAARRVQETYTCGFSTSAEIPRETRTGNDLAIYTTIPDLTTLNLVKFATDGTLWGFTTEIEQTGLRTPKEQNDNDVD